MNNRSWATAIRRNKLSAPMRHLKAAGLLKGRHLDYGSGRGDDARILGCQKFDPHYSPELPRGAFDTITCIYVLNTIPKEAEKTVIQEVGSLLSRKGKAYLAVRRDLKKEGVGSLGTFQRNVVIPLPVVMERKRWYTVYELERIP